MIFLLTENITDTFENKEQLLGIFLDVSKAFNTIDHKILLARLWHYGMRKVANNKFDIHLSNRKLLVEVKWHLLQYKDNRIVGSIFDQV